MREVRCSVGEIQQSLLAFFPSLPSSHRSGAKQSQSPGPVVEWRDYPFCQHERLFVTSFCLPFTLFPLSSGFSFSHQNSVAGFGSKVCRTQRSQACLHLKGRKKPVLFPLALAYFVGSLPDLHHCLSLPLLLLGLPAQMFHLLVFPPACHVKPQCPGNECHLTSFSLLIFL